MHLSTYKLVSFYTVLQMDLIFITDTFIEVPAITTAQMREVDRIAMEITGPNLFQMMENAGRSLAAMAIEMLGIEWKEKSIIILAGAGGNGGGGICAARHLANKGANVKLCLINQGKLSEVPGFQLKIFSAAGGQLIAPERLYKEKPELIIDAIIGYSLNGAPTGNALAAIQWANLSNTKILSLDVPSGINSTTAEMPGEAIYAERTVTLALAKKGLVSKNTGALFLADIGIPQETYRKMNLHFEKPFDDRYVVPLFIKTN
ncbi:MAG: NAD(P)H-hydrate epimerase [Saprospiraceae bacterium]